ncbi:unnamed protein product, partial [Phaeothamnion confervicola]
MPAQAFSLSSCGPGEKGGARDSSRWRGEFSRHRRRPACAAVTAEAAAAPGVVYAPASVGAVEGSETFAELYEGRLPDWLIARLSQLCFERPTLVQRRALEAILPGSDAVIHAQTGSGKTLAFLLPLLAAMDPSRAAVQGLVVVPTRELGLQVAAVAKRLAAATGPATGGRLQVMSVLEGSKNKRQRAWAKAEPPHVIIGNPGNFCALVSSGAIRVNALRFVVVDEVDACMLNPATKANLHDLLSRHLSPTFADDDDPAAAEAAAAAAVATVVAGGAAAAASAAAAAAAALRRRLPRQTVFASATVPQHRHFLKQCVRNQWT